MRARKSSAATLFFTEVLCVRLLTVCVECESRVSLRDGFTIDDSEVFMLAKFIYRGLKVFAGSCKHLQPSLSVPELCLWINLAPPLRA